MIIKPLLKYKWYRIRHLDELIPDEYKEAYDMINSGVPMGIITTVTVINIVENIKNGNLDNLIDTNQINQDIQSIKDQFEQQVKT